MYKIEIHKSYELLLHRSNKSVVDKRFCVAQVHNPVDRKGETKTESIFIALHRRLDRSLM